MSIKVILPTDGSIVTTGGLYQWDYGRVLELSSTEIGSEIVEVHFASEGMTEAIVRSCSFSNGVGTVEVPNICLEKALTITGWVYRISGEQGHTWKTFRLSVTARPRPGVNREVPPELTNRYTELIDEINEAVDALENGDVTVAKATSADNATTATSATNATTANYSVSSGRADVAERTVMSDRATKADASDSLLRGGTRFGLTRIWKRPRKGILEAFDSNPYIFKKQDALRSVDLGVGDLGNRTIFLKIWRVTKGDTIGNIVYHHAVYTTPVSFNQPTAFSQNVDEATICFYTRETGLVYYASSSDAFLLEEIFEMTLDQEESE